MKLYSLYDKIGKRHLSVTIADTDADFVRSSLFAILMDYPIRDVDAYCIGDFYTENGVLIPCAPRKIDWNCYQFPKSADSLKEEYLAIDDIRKSALEKKKKFDELAKDKVEDFKNLEKTIKKELERKELTEKETTDLTNYLKDVQEKIKQMEAK